MRALSLMLHYGAGLGLCWCLTWRFRRRCLLCEGSDREHHDNEHSGFMGASPLFFNAYFGTQMWGPDFRMPVTSRRDYENAVITLCAALISDAAWDGYNTRELSNSFTWPMKALKFPIAAASFPAFSRSICVLQLYNQRVVLAPILSGDRSLSESTGAGASCGVQAPQSGTGRWYP
jgi:hypothetical protein